MAQTIINIETLNMPSHGYAEGSDESISLEDVGVAADDDEVIVLVLSNGVQLGVHKDVLRPFINAETTDAVSHFGFIPLGEDDDE